MFNVLVFPKLLVGGETVMRAGIEPELPSVALPLNIRIHPQLPGS